jgi:hypothetical protein
LRRSATVLLFERASCAPGRTCARLDHISLISAFDALT